MKLRIQVVLMALTILGLTGFLSVWLKQTYELEKKSLGIKTDFAFKEAVQKLQVAKLKFDVVSDDSVKKKNVQLIKTGINQELKFKDNGDEKAGIISTINVITKKVKDSTGIDSPYAKRIFITKDQTLIENKINLHALIPDSLPAHDKLFRVLYSVDSLQDSIRPVEIKIALLKSFSQQNINVPFAITQADSGYKKNEADNSVTIGFAHPSTYILRLGNEMPYILKRILFPILSSVLLLAITIISFLLLYRNLIRQKRLTDIKNEFIGNITHELKTPIATVSVAIEAMKNFDVLQNPQRTQEYLDISANELQRLSLLVDNVLSLSKFEKNEIEFKKESFDFIQLTREVMESMKLQMEKRHASISLQLTGSNFIIEADRRHTSSVIYNLLDNALKYSNTDPAIAIYIMDHSSYIELRVTDNGIGIPATYHHKIFEQFFRVPEGDRHNIKGYGLGLSYVNYIVKSHHGFIEIESEEGKGSTFIVKLPFKEADVIQYDNNRTIRKKIF